MIRLTPSHIHWMLLIPFDGCRERFIKRRCTQAKRLLNGTGIDNLRLGILVKHLNHFAHDRIKHASSLDRNLGKRLYMDRLAKYFSDLLHHFTLRDRWRHNRHMPDLAESFLTFTQQLQRSRYIAHIAIAVQKINIA